jgi:hypothetical protein
MLRSAVRDLCLFNHSSIVSHEGIKKVMEEHEPVMRRVGCRVAEGYIDRQKQAMHYGVLEGANHGRVCHGCANDFIVEELNVSQYKAADESYRVIIGRTSGECDERFEFKIDADQWLVDEL